MKCSVILIVMTATAIEVLSECVWDVSKDLARFEPIFVKKVRRRHSLFIPSGPQMELATNEGLIAMCPGPNNNINNTDKTFVKLSCVAGTNVKVEANIIDMKSISCRRFVSADILNANTSASPASTVLNIGFQTDLGWLNLFNVSYDFDRITPIYAQHIIHGASLKGAYTGNSRPGFSSKGLPSRVPWSTIFTKAHQFNVLTKFMTKVEADLEYLSQTTLSRGHLAPDADFHFNTWEYGTYFYANAVPQWQSINNGNWKRIENAVRNKAKELQEDIKVTTGVEGVSTLKGHELYLSGNEVPVPRYIWKIICTKKGECIALVIVNNPFESEDQYVCENLCTRQFDTVGWYLSSFDDVKKGRVLCCSVSELKKKNGFKDKIPDMLVKGLLRY